MNTFIWCIVWPVASLIGATLSGGITKINIGVAIGLFAGSFSMWLLERVYDQNKNH